MRTKYLTTHNDDWKQRHWGEESLSCFNCNSSTNPLMWVRGSMNTYFVCMSLMCIHKGHWGSVIVTERWREKTEMGKSIPMAKRQRERLSMSIWRGKMEKEAKREWECRKPLAPCLQSAICWWRSSWRGGAQRPFLAMRSSLINKTKRVSCVTPSCYLQPCSRTPFISI